MSVSKLDNGGSFMMCRRIMEEPIRSTPGHENDKRRGAEILRVQILEYEKVCRRSQIRGFLKNSIPGGNVIHDRRGGSDIAVHCVTPDLLNKLLPALEERSLVRRT